MWEFLKSGTVVEALIGGIFTILSALIAWFFRHVKDEIRNVKKETKEELTDALALVSKDISYLQSEASEARHGIHAIKEELPKTYVNKHDFDKFQDRLFQRLDNIQSKIEVIISGK